MKYVFKGQKIKEGYAVCSDFCNIFGYKINNINQISDEEIIKGEYYMFPTFQVVGEEIVQENEIDRQLQVGDIVIIKGSEAKILNYYIDLDNNCVVCKTNYTIEVINDEREKEQAKKLKAEIDEKRNLLTGKLLQEKEEKNRSFLQKLKYLRLGEKK